MVHRARGSLLNAYPDARRCAVLGSPVAHSLSPVLHRAAYEALGLAWSYDAHAVTQQELPGFLDGLDASWRGLSLTNPLKRLALRLVADVSPVARSAGAVNTILLERGHPRRGDNTDVPGMVAALRERGVTEVSEAVVLGAGATAASALVAMAALGLDSAVVCARDTTRAAHLLEIAERLGVALRVAELPGSAALRADLVVSTLPADVAGALAKDVVQLAPVVFDVAYSPWPPAVVGAAAASGRVVVSGLDLLLHQAARQVELMTGFSPAPLDAMRAAIHNSRR